MIRRYGGPGMHGAGGVPLASMGGGAAASYARKVLGYGPIAYWPLWEASGTVAACLVNPAQNGAYRTDVSGWPPGTGIGDGNTAPFFDGTNDYVDVFTATYSAAFNGAEGTASAWFRVANAGVWTDATTRFLFRYRADADNYVDIERTTTNHRISGVYRAGGVFSTQGNTYAPSGPTDWVHSAVTWSKSANQFRFFLNGSQIGVTVGALGVWVGAPAATLTVLGASSTVPAAVWNGWLAHCVVWDRALLPGEIAIIATI